jgi:hypothetical protein
VRTYEYDLGAAETRRRFRWSATRRRRVRYEKPRVTDFGSIAAHTYMLRNAVEQLAFGHVSGGSDGASSERGGASSD